MTKIFSKSPKSKAYKSKAIKVWTKEEIDLYDRHRSIPGWFQDRLGKARIVVIGAGGLGGEVVEGLLRKGIREVHVFDPDFVDPTNLPRQKFYKRDLYKNKALRLARNLVKEATGKSMIVGYPFAIQEKQDIRDRINESFEAAIVLVDNEATREFCSRSFTIPTIFSAVGMEAERFYVMVQEPGGPCYRCAVPKPDVAPGRHHCNAASSIDAAKAIGGFVLYALDSILMNRARRWNYREANFSGGVPFDKTLRIESNPDCWLCGMLKGMCLPRESMFQDELAVREWDKEHKSGGIVI